MTEALSPIGEIIQKLQEHYDILEEKKNQFFAQADSLSPNDYTTVVTAKSAINSLGTISGALAFVTLTEMMMLELIDAATKDASKVEEVRVEFNKMLATHGKGLKWLERFQSHTPETEKVE
ncbi:MAG TPA: hypothetical protein VGR53_05355 [Nitrososphaerales archaeon]|nr:hypothetical protein [Nitrososphaerales archaeon]